MRSTIILAFAIATLVSPRIGSAQGPRERDVWYEYVQDGVRFGYQHVKVERLSDGNYRYLVELKHLIDMFGQLKQESSSKAEYIVTPNLQPISVRVDAKDQAGPWQVRSQMDGKVLVLTLKRGEEESKQRVDFSKDDKLVLSSCLEDRLAMSAEGKSVTLREVSREGFVSEVTAKRQSEAGAARAVWQIGTVGGFGGRELRFDESGVVDSMLVKLQDLKLQRCPEAQARKIVHRLLDGRELLTFALDKKISAPSRLRLLDVTICWRDIPFKEFALEDPRQRVSSHSVKDGLHTARIEIRKPAKAADKTTIPVSDTKLARYLADTAFVKPKHAKILATAKKIVGDEKNAIAAVRAISKWVHGYINGQLSATTLTGPQVLECRSGKCTEYSTLFASLARAAGIPAKLALGERLMNGQWMGHMWNEAWVGRWVSVDSTVNEVDESFLLLKFIDSDTVMGTQPLRWKLTKSLEISIDRFELAPSTLAAKYKTGIVGTTYTNVDRACRVKAPAGWKLKDKSSPQAATVQFIPPDSKGVLLHFVAFPLPKGTPPKAVLANRVRMWKRSYKDFEQHVDKAYPVRGAPGHRSRISGTAKNGLKNSHSEVLWAHGDSGYLVFMISLDKAHKTHLASFETLLKRFEFLKD